MNSSDEAAPLPQTSTILKGAWRLIVLEFWERFSYYGILAILVLFLTSPAISGGLGWTSSRALDLLSKFTAVAFIMPTLGGYIADRWIGARRAVLIGSCLLVVGNLAITLAALWSTLTVFASQAGATETVLFAGIGCIALGNGFFKSSLITLLGSLIPNDDAARDQTFRNYYQSIMLGALASALCVGSLAEAVGWWSGFALAAAGMAVSWLMFIVWRDPVEAGARRVSAPHVASTSENSSSGSIAGVGILYLFLPLITIGWVQFQGLWLLEVERWGDRNIGAFTVPTPWLLAVNAIAIVLLVPIVGRWWRRIVQSETPRFVTQFITAFLIMGIAHLLMAFGFRAAVPGGVSLLWPVGCLLIITIAEAIFWPSSYNAIHRVAPARVKSLVMGLWLAMLGVGQYFTHQVARASEVLGFATLSAYIGLGLLMSGATLWLISRLQPGLRLI